MTIQWSYLTTAAAAAAAKSIQSCLTLCDPTDGSPPGSPGPGILQARILEWVAISFSNAWKWKVKAKSLSRVWLLATSWTAAYQGPPSMGFSRQEYWSGVPLPSPITKKLKKFWGGTFGGNGGKKDRASVSCKTTSRGLINVYLESLKEQSYGKTNIFEKLTGKTFPNLIKFINTQI